MIDDFKPVGKRKPKVIQPLAKPVSKPLLVLSDGADSTAEESQFAALPSSTSKASSSQSAADAAIKATLTSSAEPESTLMVANGQAITDVQKPKPWFKRLAISWPPTKRQSLIIGTLILLLIAGGGAVWAQFFNKAPTVVGSVAKPKAVKPKVVAPTTVASTLSGLQVAADVNKRPVTAVMIENSVDARPQSGLDQASVVFEAVAEGGVTRFMAVFQDTQPDYIGPVRSARPYYIAWALGFDAGYAHVGGSPDGLADIKSWGVRDLDEFANAGAYQRITSRYAPHNVYTSIAQLNSLEQAKGYGSSTFTGFARKADQPYKAPSTTSTSATKPISTKSTKPTTPTPSDTRTPVTSIDMSLSGYYYNPHFDYDAASNNYKRSEEQQPHMELSSGGAQTQITPKVVIGMVVPESQGALDSSGAFYSNYNPIGSGAAYVFQDGTVTVGTWAKTSNTSQISFTDSSGAALKLDAGQTWITAITDSSKLSYK